MNIKQNPSLQILLFGFLLGLVLLIIAGPRISNMESDQVIISDAEVAYLSANWERTWQRKPTEKELKGLIENYTREEVLYREALKREMDQNNLTIRRALVTQMETLAESQAADKEITEQDLQSYFALRKEQYRQPGRLSYLQIYFNTDRRGEDEAITLAKQTLGELQQQAIDQIAPEDFGDPIMIPAVHEKQSEQNVQSAFGEAFAQKLFELNPEQWEGPVASAYGLHLVYIFEKEPSAIPNWEDIRFQLLQDLQYDEKQASREQFYIEIMRQYNIVYEGLAKELITGVQ